MRVSNFLCTRLGSNPSLQLKARFGLLSASRFGFLARAIRNSNNMTLAVEGEGGGGFVSGAQRPATDEDKSLAGFSYCTLALAAT